MNSNLPSKVVITAGTYDGVLAGWELEKRKEKMKLTFATTVHSGSIRSLSLASAASNKDGDDCMPGSLLSCGYDETLRTHDWHKRLTSSGEIRTPSDFGTPVCSAFAPPSGYATHCVVGFSHGKIAIYKKRDWSIQHVLAGHDGGVCSLAVHPSAKLAISGGESDGKLKLWDLTKGRLAYVNKISRSTKTNFDPITSLVWSNDGTFYGFAHGAHITVREVASGRDLLDVDLPSRVNQICLLQGEYLFVAAACNDGSLPVLAVEDSDNENRRAIMAIEPVDSVVAREERFKCIAWVNGYNVVTANSAGVVSLMNLDGAVKMIMEDEDEEIDETPETGSTGSTEDNDEGDSAGDDIELAVNIIDSVQLGSGARITCLAAWSSSQEERENNQDAHDGTLAIEKSGESLPGDRSALKRKHAGTTRTPVTMDSVALQKARALVNDAKNLNERRERKKRQKSKTK